MTSLKKQKLTKSTWLDSSNVVIPFRNFIRKTLRQNENFALMYTYYIKQNTQL